MARRRYYTSRRVPQSVSPSYARKKLLPFIPRIIANTTMAQLSHLTVLPKPLREDLAERAEKLGAQINEDSQRVFFDDPGLDTLTVRSVAHHARRLSRMGRGYLRARIALHLDPDGRAAATLPLVPDRGYDSLMTVLLALGTALGNFKGGEVHAEPFYDSGAADGPDIPVTPGHPTPVMRRYGVPESLGDLCADIDDMYWAMGFGQAVKITRVGQGEERRWLVSLPGTFKWSLQSTPNPADIETNIRELLNLPSAFRVGTINAIQQAMIRDGVTWEQIPQERILMCGHSLGGVLATACAAADPAELGLNVSAVMTLGTPSRRLRIRDGVVMLSVDHDQDVVPSLDATPDQLPDRRAKVGRALIRPRKAPLYYAHSSATYTETVRKVERRAAIVSSDRVALTVKALQEYLPREGEGTRVMVFDVWQDLLPTQRRDTWDAFVPHDRPEWEPVDYQAEWSPNPLFELPDLTGAIPQLQRKASVAVNELGRGMAEAAVDLQKTVVNMANSVRRQHHDGSDNRGKGASDAGGDDVTADESAGTLVEDDDQKRGETL